MQITIIASLPPRKQEILRLISDAREAAATLRDLAETVDSREHAQSILAISEELTCSASFADMEIRGEVQ